MWWFPLLEALSLELEAEPLAGWKTWRKSQETGASGQTGPAPPALWRLAHTALAWLGFSSFCIQIVVPEIYFILHFLNPLGT